MIQIVFGMFLNSKRLCDINKFENIFIYYHFLKYLVKMDQKSAKLIDSKLRNVTKAEHDPKRDLCSKC